VPGPGEEVISRKGQTLDRKVFEEMRTEFYELRGWDAESGLQKAETLEGLGMSDLVIDLKKIGLIEGSNK
ncbi:MAG TPA: aldehyde ferredoxin oxidoreductase C-terminal domain-containing protein, partial [Desulfobacterales bacterium]|nr:aldehyde ferredoxin oxidoreductase C-terminal domain-containing protein [Desulfobacterales bacterium]